MSRTSLRRTLEAVDTQPIVLVVVLAGSNLERSIAKQVQSKASNYRAATQSFFRTGAKWER